MHRNECVWFVSIDAQLLFFFFVGRVFEWKNSICSSNHYAYYVVQQTTQTFRCPPFSVSKYKSTIPYTATTTLLKQFSMYLFIPFSIGILNMLCVWESVAVPSRRNNPKKKRWKHFWISFILVSVLASYHCPFKNVSECAANLLHETFVDRLRIQTLHSIHVMHSWVRWLSNDSI